jgi:hypothetical protein
MQNLKYALDGRMIVVLISNSGKTFFSLFQIVLIASESHPASISTITGVSSPGSTTAWA